MTTFYGWDSEDSLRSSDASVADRVVRDSWFLYSAPKYNTLSEPIFVKSAHPYPPCFYKVGPKTKIKILGHAFDTDDTMTSALSFEYHIAYPNPENKSIQKTSSLGTANLSNPSRLNIDKKKCYIYEVNKEYTIRNITPDYDKIEVFTVCLTLKTDKDVGNENCISFILLEPED